MRRWAAGRGGGIAAQSAASEAGNHIICISESIISIISHIVIWCSRDLPKLQIRGEIRLLGGAVNDDLEHSTVAFLEIYPCEDTT